MPHDTEPSLAPVIVIGAGLAGLACADVLGSAALVFEREECPGGAARSFERYGFSFDVTGHWLHLREPEVVRLIGELFSADELVTVARRAVIHSHGVRTPYPFQANTYGLPVNIVAECVLGYFKAREQAARGILPPP